MVFGKNYRVFYRTDHDSLLLTKRNGNGESLLIQRNSITELSRAECDNLKPLYTICIDAYGCLGILEFELGNLNTYLVLIKSILSVGKIEKTEIFRITGTAFVSFRNINTDLDKIKCINHVLDSGSFYFSSTPENEKPFDLTLNAQRKLRSNETDNRFFWNRTFYIPFINNNIDSDKWLVKVICGGVTISTVYVGHYQARVCLFSRLSSERAGTRFIVRGVDDEGCVANFVETEQCIFLDSKVTSYVIVRGSVPLFWEQPGINLGSHKIKISRGCEISQPAYDRHLVTLKKRYGKQVFINLMGCKEGESMLSKIYKTTHDASNYASDVPYIEFDYHTHCPRGKSNIFLLGKQIEKYFEDFSFFTSGDCVELRQIGCFRVNCVDCLDRTNCVQTFIGLEILKSQLISLSLFEKTSRFEETLKNMWIANGDQISRIYAGTGALEGKSKIKDSTLSLARTIQNNIYDATKQGAFDLLLNGKMFGSESFDRARALLASEYLHLNENFLISFCDQYLKYTDKIPIKVVVATWNVNGSKHFTNLAYKKTDPLSDWLLDFRGKQSVSILDLSIDDLPNNNPADIFIIGFEEIVDLNASNIVAASTTNQREWLYELQKTISRDTPYILVSSVQLVGVCLYVFVRPHHAPFIRNVATDQVKTGLGGATGNKGGVAIRMLFHSTSICCLCAHFAAGQNQVQDRNSDYLEITKKINFHSNRSLHSHDYIFWCGDFNYRIDLDNELVRESAAKGDYQLLMKYDQLKVQQAKGKIFKNFIEGDINFPPTYKYDSYSDDYDTSEKCRTPAYTDRILFKKNRPTTLDENNFDQIKINFYGSVGLKTSDHRPVVAEFDITVLKVDKDKRDALFHELIQNHGPFNPTIVVKSRQNIELNDSLVGEIVKLFNNKVGEVISFFCFGEYLHVTFSDGTLAIQAMNTVLDSICNDLIIELQTPNWIENVLESVKLGKDNTISLSENNEYNLDKSVIDSNKYEVKILESNILDIQSSLVTDIPNEIIYPVRPAPPPPQMLNKIKDHALFNETKPVRPAPPVIAIEQEAKISEKCFNKKHSTESLGKNFESFDGEDFDMPPPILPAPLLQDEDKHYDDATTQEKTIRSSAPPPIPERPSSKIVRRPPPPLPQRSKITFAPEPPLIPPRRAK